MTYSRFLQSLVWTPASARPSHGRERLTPCGRPVLPYISKTLRSEMLTETEAVADNRP